MEDERRHVVVVEDNKDISDLLDIILTGAGYKPEIHNDYDWVARRNDVLAYMLDFHCPPYNGDNWLKQNEVYVPVSKRILMSGDDGWKDSGYNGFLLSKPFQVRQIHDYLKQIMEKDER